MGDVMSKYSWDLDKLIQKRDYLERQFKMYEELFDLYTELIENYHKKYEPTVEFSAGVTPHFIHLKENFEQIGNEKITLLKNAFNTTIYFDSSLEEPKFTRMFYNDQDLVEKTRALFEKIPNKYLLEKFDEFTNPDNNLLHIRKHKVLPTDSFGLTFTDPVEHTPYGLVARYYSAQDIITLGHEVFHMIIREHEELAFYKSKKTIYMETEGFFANLLFADLLKEEGYNSKELDLFEKKDLNLNIDTMRICFILDQCFKYINKKGKINFEKVIPTLRSKNIMMPLDKNNFPGLFSSELSSDVNDATSYLPALDLYEQYKYDPEKAIYHLQKIPTLSGEKPEEDLRGIGVTFFEDGHKNFENKCKQLLKTKTTSDLK